MDSFIFKVIFVGAIITTTLIDLIRVAFFGASSDIPFFAVTMLLQVILFMNIMAKIFKNGIRQ